MPSRGANHTTRPRTKCAAVELTRLRFIFYLFASLDECYRDTTSRDSTRSRGDLIININESVAVEQMRDCTMHVGRSKKAVFVIGPDRQFADLSKQRRRRLRPLHDTGRQAAGRGAWQSPYCPLSPNGLEISKLISSRTTRRPSDESRL